MITLQQAAPQDADALTAIQTRTFDDDSRRHGRGERGGPPGYDSVAWQLRMMHATCYFKILDDGRIIGGAIVFAMDDECCVLGRIYIAPEHQNQGFGGQALRLIEALYPAARRWTLDTPTWALRNQHFYERHGYVKIGEVAPDGEDFAQVLYEKTV